MRRDDDRADGDAGGGFLFTGWQVDGTIQDYANPAQLTLSGNRVQPTFAAQPTFNDIPQSGEVNEAITQLAARGVILGYGQAGYAALGVSAPASGRTTRSPARR
ncbi:MAG: hypothetical protein U0841_10010 [Chloroflexia bacterium]